MKFLYLKVLFAIAFIMDIHLYTAEVSEDFAKTVDSNSSRFILEKTEKFSVFSLEMDVPTEVMSAPTETLMTEERKQNLFEELLAIAEAREAFYNLSPFKEHLKDGHDNYRFIKKKLLDIRNENNNSIQNKKISALYSLIQYLYEKERANYDHVKKESRNFNIDSGIWDLESFGEILKLMQQFNILPAYEKFHRNFYFDVISFNGGTGIGITPRFKMKMIENSQNNVKAEKKATSEKMNELMQMPEISKNNKKNKEYEENEYTSTFRLLEKEDKEINDIFKSIDEKWQRYADWSKDRDRMFKFMMNFSQFYYDSMQDIFKLSEQLKTTRGIVNGYIENCMKYLKNKQQEKLNKRMQKKAEQQAFNEQNRNETMAILHEREAENERKRQEYIKILHEREAELSLITLATKKLKIKTKGTAIPVAINSAPSTFVSAPVHSVVIPVAIQELVAEIKDANTDFSRAQVLLTKSIDNGGIGAECVSTNEGYQFKFRSSVTGVYTMCYVHKPHGAQLEKGAAVGWRKNIIAALIRAGMAKR